MAILSSSAAIADVRKAVRKLQQDLDAVSEGKGKQGDPGPAGASALDLFRAMTGNPTATMQDMFDTLKGAPGDEGPMPDANDLSAAVASYMAANPAPAGKPGDPGRPGADASTDQIQQAVAGWLQANPPASGTPGANATPQQIAQAVADWLSVNPPAPGRDATPDQISAAVTAWLNAHPPAKGDPGLNASPDQIASAVAAYLIKWPPPPGTPGQPGANATDAQVASALSAYMAANPPAGFNVRTPEAVSITPGTAYQFRDKTKPFKITVNARSTLTTTLLALTAADKVELRVGPTAASVALNGAGGFSVGVWESGITGIAVVVGMGIQDGGQLSADLPAGWFYAVNRLSGTTATIVSAFAQSLS